jgi:2,4-dienoyl-CoA reductase-like NADH-dependent reductase (Old Yellow Enzyme family)
MTDLFETLKIGRLECPNRFVRSATMENLGSQGMVTDALVSVYRELAAGEVGLIITGGLFPKKTGRISEGQLGAHTDEMISGLKRLVKVAHDHGSKIAAQLLHSGWLCSEKVTGFEPEAPSAVVSPFDGTMAREVSGDEVWELVELFAQAGRRTMEAGSDAVQFHGAHSHLISSFLSPVTNRRQDEWGGSPEKRRKFILELYKRTRQLTGPDYPIMVKLGFMDYHPQGKPSSEGIETAQALANAGMCSIEISEGLEEIMAHHIREGASEPYFLEECRLARTALSVPLILVGGMRSLEDMQAVLDEGMADGISMSRPFINDPRLVQKFREGLTRESGCISCNECIADLQEGNFGCVLNG